MADTFDLHICCMGAGYVGGPTMAVIAAKCPKVTAGIGIDVACSPRFGRSFHAAGANQPVPFPFA